MLYIERMLSYVSILLRLVHKIDLTQALFIIFFREFQSMTFAYDYSSLSSDQEINQFLVQTKIEPQISYSSISYFTN